MAGRTSPFAAKLAQSKALWDTAKEKAKEAGGYGSFEDLPPGRYLARLVQAELGETDGKLWVRFVLGVLEGDMAGQKQSALDGLATEQNWVHFGRKVQMFGYDPDALEMEEIPEFLNTLIVSQETACRITVKANGEYTNVYLNEVTDDVSLDDYADVEFDGVATPEGGGDDGDGDASWSVYCASLDEQDPIPDADEAVDAACAEAGLSSADYGTWAECGAALDAATEPEPEAEPEPEPAAEEPDEQSWTEYGADLDTAGAESDEVMDAQARSEGHDPMDYATYAELGAVLDAGTGEGEPAEGDDDTGELTVGASVMATHKGSEIQGTVSKIDEEAETVTVKPNAGQTAKKAFTVGADAIELLD